MDAEQMQKALKALEREKKRNLKQNEYIKGKYDRYSLTLPKGTKQRIDAVVKGSVNQFFADIIMRELDRLEKEQISALDDDLVLPFQ